MPTRWCVNFDVEPVLRHGLANGMWLMQYQYSHGGFDFQGHPTHLPATATNWRNLTDVAAGDWFVAYLKPSTFYAIGEVTAPRIRARHIGAALQADTVARTVQDRDHRFLNGVVRYSDAQVLYEDFTESDSWTCPVDPERPNQPSAWQYPQRIDVREWELVVPDGVRLAGLAAEVEAPAIRRAAFKIPDDYFRRIVNALVAERLHLANQ